MLRQGCEERCPGCSHRELSAEQSESQKTEWLGRALGSWSATLAPIRVVSGERRWGYRDKTLLRAQWNGSHWEFGMRIRAPREKRRAFDFVAIPECPIHSERIRLTLAILAKRLPGASKFNLAFVAVSGAIVTLVVKSALAELPELNAELKNISMELGLVGITGVFLNFNASTGNRVFSSHGWKKIWGEETASGYLGLQYGPQSFQQLITPLFEDALNEAENWLRPASSDFVADLYCGLGASVRRWLQAGAETVGVELLGEAVRLSGFVSQGVVLRGKVSERLPQIRERALAWSSHRNSGRLKIFANPPRTGIEDVVLEWMGEVRAERIAYLSCSAGTLARDLSKLEKSAYRVRRILPYDFFPQTPHVETLAFLDLDSG